MWDRVLASAKLAHANSRVQAIVRPVGQNGCDSAINANQRSFRPCATSGLPSLSPESNIQAPKGHQHGHGILAPQAGRFHHALDAGIGDSPQQIFSALRDFPRHHYAPQGTLCGVVGGWNVRVNQEIQQTASTVLLQQAQSQSLIDLGF